MAQLKDTNVQLSRDEKVARHILQSMQTEGIPIPEEKVAHLTEVICDALHDQTETVKKVEDFQRQIEGEQTTNPFPHLSGLSTSARKKS